MNRTKLVYKHLPVDYKDCFSREVVDDISVDDVFNNMFCEFPVCVQAMLRLRDVMVKPLGLKTGTSFADHIVERNGEEIVIGTSDRHLSFWVSVYCGKSGAGIAARRVAEVRTLVKYHHFLGRLYFAGILIFHWLIVRSLFHRATRKCNSQPEA